MMNLHIFADALPDDGDANLNASSTPRRMPGAIRTAQGAAPYWAFGDFDYSGHVTGDDYSLFLAGLRKQPVL
jgi:hypothetical protein